MRYSPLLVLLLTCIVTGQEITWSESPGPITALKIICDTDSVPIYLDGQPVGTTPIKEPVQVAPGWHQISYFPQDTIKGGNKTSEAVVLSDIIHLARQDVLAEEGKTTQVVLSYRSIEAEVKDYQAKLESSRWIGLVMAIITLLIISWGTV